MSSAQVLEQQEVVGSPRVHGPVHLRVGVGSKMADSIEGQAKIAAALSRFADYCERTETPWIPCHRGNVSLEVEDREPAGITS